MTIRQQPARDRANGGKVTKKGDRIHHRYFDTDRFADSGRHPWGHPDVEPLALKEAGIALQIVAPALESKS